MRKTLSLLTAALATLVIGQSASADFVVDFDTAANWTAGSGSIGSYQSDHTYSDSGMVFTGGPALRQTASTQDGFDAALGTYSWRLRNTNTVTWTATYATVGDSEVEGFSFDVRRWDSNPSPAFDVSYSVTGAAGPFASVGTINNTFLGGSSDWSNFSHTFTSNEIVSDGDLVVRLVQATTGERIMIDNFSLNTVSAVPEPAGLGVLALAGLGLVLRRRK